MAFIYFQSSKKRKRSADCSVRTLMASEHISWEEAFDILCGFARKVQDMPNETRVLTKAIESLGYKAMKVPSGPKMTMKEFAKDHKKGEYILYLAGHVVYMKNGNWYDTWDASEYKVLKYFVR